MAGIVFDHATKAFGAFKAVNELTLTIDEGEFLVLVGPSGSGKSTALRMLAASRRSATAASPSTTASSTTSNRRTATSPWSSSPTPSTPT